MVEGKILHSSERGEPFPEGSPFLENILAVKTAGEPFLQPSLWIFRHFNLDYFLYRALEPGFVPSGQLNNYWAGTPFLFSPLYCESNPTFLSIYVPH